ncbi:helicase-related protein [Flexibacterium corallicola]|uniref:helicase-related protein n=1 Tax=Flexibacterium corallicola TaxID=3037259 RepID=UPI00286F3EA4|nr:helicase-related protein [Pseudovibrio sp. M1P-2-3]
MAANTTQDARDSIIERLTEDIIGPSDPNEIIDDRPSDRYLTGILFPIRTARDAAEDDESGEPSDTQESDTGMDSIRADSTFRPSSAGLSFAVRPRSKAQESTLIIRIRAGRYVAAQPEDGKDTTLESALAPLWQRIPRIAEISLPVKETRGTTLDLATNGLSNATLHMRATWWDEVLLITLAVSNSTVLNRGASREESEEAGLFQTSILVECLDGDFVPKPEHLITGQSNDDEDDKALALLYRDVDSYAVGHNCSADWQMGEDGKVESVHTTWLPETLIHPISAEGDNVFRRFAAGGAAGPLGASWLASANRVEIVPALTSFVDAYETWIDARQVECAALHDFLRVQGEKHLDQCRQAAARMRRGIDLLDTSNVALDAFSLANHAIALQQSWKAPNRPLVWRPFQIGFALLCLRSLADSEDEDRDLMDLLWFPTGGGKTEAYLLLTAFKIFLRRLEANGGPDGAGVSAFMRYTLRLLTIQQFERASALICACELIRRGLIDTGPVALPPHFANDAEISIGLWVGSGATPNTITEAIEALDKETEASPKQLQKCPCCHSLLRCAPNETQSRIEFHCINTNCKLSGTHLPIWTVDVDIYRQLPTLIIGTVDKYAQIVRSEDAGKLFGAGTDHLPPELIIQDELHLISGPLGSLAGLYEVAIDELCQSEGAPAKVIGSTATIRRARNQVSGLFDRNSFQFPPPGLVSTNSGFSVEDRTQPGRRFLGVSTVGRSAKFALQAVEASLLQSGANLPDDCRDGYWTVVNYFNSLRELGGSLVLMRDDVARTLTVLKGRRKTDIERRADTQIELTSRIPSSEIPAHLKQLEAIYGEEGVVDIVLASNMISVGMDVSRLGLMVVNGQPKTIAEYIQATSRVGRNSSAPGLVLSVYNANKARDRSRYESFTSWHQALYREVEATSVTPFAKRARDRALHAPLVAMARHLLPGFNRPDAVHGGKDGLLDLVDDIVDRIRRIDPDEAEGAFRELRHFVDNWADNTPEKYWDDYREALLISAETYTERNERAFAPGQRPTPNSLRSVEAATTFFLERTFAPRRDRDREREPRRERTRSRIRRQDRATQGEKSK